MLMIYCQRRNMSNIREKIAELGCYCNEHPHYQGVYNIYLFLCRLCYKQFMKELKVGERVTITLEAVEQKTCKGCFFDNYGCNASDMFKCGYANRSDGKGIIFKEVKE